MKAAKVFKTTPEKYHAAVKRCMRVHRRAYRKFNLKLRSKLGEMMCSDKKFWSITKEIGGVTTTRSTAAPGVEDLVQFFATKMSNAKNTPDPEFKPTDGIQIPL